MSKSSLRAALLGAAIALSAGAVPLARAESVSVAKILEATDRVRGGGLPGVEWKLKITATDPFIGGDVRELVVRAAGDNSVAETTYPPRAAGGRLLQQGRNMWYHRPDLQKPVSISTRQKMIGAASNGDIASTNYLKDYDATLLREERVDNEDAYVLELAGKSKWVTYDRIIYWVSKSRLVPVKAEFYTVSGKLFKTASFDIQNTVRYNGQQQPFVSRMVIRDAINSDSVSVLEYSAVQAKKLPASEFSVSSIGD